ncbi:MAG TPA: EamA family transporter [bacterium]|jgi:drug/metabolite transporter (DMT)-like permease|nr:EamA family transporter [bacterium]
MANLFCYVCVLLTVFFGVYGQLILKARILKAGAIPADFHEKINFSLNLLADPWVISAFVGAFLAALCWMGALTRLPLSYAYPFTCLTFVLILILSSVFFHEPITLAKTLGLAFIIAGIIISSLG